jgi:hypothetical protein
MVVFSPGELEQVFDGIQIIPDLTCEPDETFTVRVTHVEWATVSDGEATGHDLGRT